MSERVCERCFGLRGEMEGKRSDARFCCDKCRYEAWAEKRRPTAYNGYQGSRRPSRDGHGIRIYFTPADLDELQSCLHIAAPERLRRKVRGAIERVENPRPAQ